MALAGMVAGCHRNDDLSIGSALKLKLTSPGFSEGQPIPNRHALEGGNASPALEWSGVPGAKSLALICEDPDAPAGTWVHWVLYDLPPGTSKLAEGVPKSPELTDGAKQGVNDFGKIGYDGPSPPPGKAHRYYFKVYALDAKPELKTGLGKKDLVKAMEGHVLAEGELMGTYEKK